MVRALLCWLGLHDRSEELGTQFFSNYSMTITYRCSCGKKWEDDFT